MTLDGAYVLNAEPTLLLELECEGKSKFSENTIELLSKCTFSGFNKLFISCGLSAEINEVQPKFKVQNFLSQFGVYPNLVLSPLSMILRESEKYNRLEKESMRSN